MVTTPIEATWPSEPDLRAWLLSASAAVPAAAEVSQLPHEQPRKPKHHRGAYQAPVGVERLLVCKRGDHAGRRVALHGVHVGSSSHWGT